MTSNIIFSLVALVGAFFTVRAISFFIQKLGESKNILPKRVYYVDKFLQFLIVIILIMVLSVIWEVKVGGIMIFASSIFAVIGVALFAQWSILSNLTASIIIFFTFPARVGDRIKVLDGDNSIIGEIKEISLFQIEIIDDENNLVLYPNNLFLQKPIIKLVKKVEENKIEEEIEEKEQI